MGRGPVIATKKMLSNAAKQKIFTIHSKLISIAASKGGDPDKNPALKDAIEKAKKDNFPNENIQRAIKRGTGEDKTATKIDNIIYEGYGPGGVAIIISALTDNKNRTASNIRHIFSKYGGNMGEPGSVSFIFEKKGVLAVCLENYDKTKLEEMVFETSVQDFWEEDGLFKIITSIKDFNEVKSFFEKKGIIFDFADIDYIPLNIVEISDFDKALKLTKMIQVFNQDEDVEKISTNMNISPQLQKQVDDFIEKNTFKT